MRETDTGNPAHWDEFMLLIGEDVPNLNTPKPEAGNFAARFTLAKGIIDELGDILLADIVAVRQMLIDGNIGEALEYLTIMQEAVEKEMGDEDE